MRLRWSLGARNVESPTGGCIQRGVRPMLAVEVGSKKEIPGQMPVLVRSSQTIGLRIRPKWRATKPRSCWRSRAGV